MPPTQSPSRGNDDLKRSRSLGDPAPSFRSIAIVIGCVLFYAIVRYHLLKGVPWHHFPLYVVNKASAVSAVFFFALALAFPAIRKTGNGEERRCALAGLVLVSIHAMISMLILNAGYFPMLFRDGKLNLTGEISLLLGIVALTIAVILATGALPPLRTFSERAGERLKVCTLALAGAHVYFLGIASWLKPSAWPGNLPPLTLVSFVVVVCALMARWHHRGNKEASGKSPE